MRSGYKEQIVLNLDTFLKIVPYPCLVDELRLRLFAAVPTA